MSWSSVSVVKFVVLLELNPFHIRYNVAQCELALNSSPMFASSAICFARFLMNVLVTLSVCSHKLMISFANISSMSSNFGFLPPPTDLFFVAPVLLVSLLLSFFPLIENRVFILCVIPIAEVLPCSVRWVTFIHEGNNLFFKCYSEWCTFAPRSHDR